MYFAILFWYLGLLTFENELPFLVTLNTWSGEQPHLNMKELGLAKERTELKASLREGFGVAVDELHIIYDTTECFQQHVAYYMGCADGDFLF